MKDARVPYQFRTGTMSNERLSDSTTALIKAALTEFVLWRGPLTADSAPPPLTTASPPCDDAQPRPLRLEELVRSGLVVLNPWSPNGFPTARVVVPVYDSGGTQTPPLAPGWRQR